MKTSKNDAILDRDKEFINYVHSIANNKSIFQFLLKLTQIRTIYEDYVINNCKFNDACSLIDNINKPIGDKLLKIIEIKNDLITLDIDLSVSTSGVIFK